MRPASSRARLSKSEQRKRNDLIDAWIEFGLELLMQFLSELAQEVKELEQQEAILKGIGAPIQPGAGGDLESLEGVPDNPAVANSDVHGSQVDYGEA